MRQAPRLRRGPHSGRARPPSTILAVATLTLLAVSAGSQAFAAGGDGWSPEEQQFVYELNRIRWNPAAAGFSVGSVLPAPPLAVNSSLAAASGSRADEMAAFDYFSHQSPITGLRPNEIARQYGYPLPRSWPDNANNIESAHFGCPTATGALQSLLGSPPHRAHLLGQGGFATHREIGVGAHLGERIWSIMTATDGTGPLFLTGVVYTDTNGNGRMDVGEGLSDVTVAAGTFSTKSSAAGGWVLQVPAGSYRVSATGGRFSGKSTAVVRVGGFNVELDFVSGRRHPDVYSYQTCGGLSPTILGTGAAETITGTSGDDVILGGGRDDDIDGMGGNDVICGGGGNDLLNGGSGHDILLGGPGDDSCEGGEKSGGCEGS